MAEILKNLARELPKEEKARREMYEAARELFLSLETPFDAMHRLYWSMSLIPLTQVGVDMGLFRKLSEQPDTRWPVDDLAASLTVDSVLLYRILRYLSSFGLVSEQNDQTYSSNDITRWLASSGGEGGLKHYHLNIAPVLNVLPSVLQRQGYSNPVDPVDTAFQVAHDTKLHCYSWMPEDRSRVAAFLNFMQSQRANQRIWIEHFPTQLLRLSETEASEDRVLFVDVGGAGGHQCLALRKSAPELKGKIILQDQERVISGVDSPDLKKHGVEAMVHDFFAEQPVKYAKSYYMRNIMHDWPDLKCIDILKNLKDAMADDSMILIDDTVLPDFGANWKQTQKDIQMMAVAAAMERSVSQWNDLLAKAGLKIHSTHTYDKDLGDSIIVAVRP